MPLPAVHFREVIGFVDWPGQRKSAKTVYKRERERERVEILRIANGGGNRSSLDRAGHPLQTLPSLPENSQVRDLDFACPPLPLLFAPRSVSLFLREARRSANLTVDRPGVVPNNNTDQRGPTSGGRRPKPRRLWPGAAPRATSRAVEPA